MEVDFNTTFEMYIYIMTCISLWSMVFIVMVLHPKIPFQHLYEVSVSRTAFMIFKNDYGMGTYKSEWKLAENNWYSRTIL